MADNTVLNAGAGGDTIASDDILGIKHQRVKIEIGADGAAADVHSGNPLPVSDAGGSLTVDGPLTDAQLRATPVPVSGTVTANAGTGTLATDPIDRAARDNGKVDVASLDQYTPTDVDTGVGVDNAVPVALRLPAAGGGVSAPGDAANGLDVDVTRLPALPAGTNNIGDVDVLTLPSLPAGANNIGDVDVLTLPALPAGTNNIGDVDVVTLPALPAGTNNIGDVDVLTLPGVAGDVAHDGVDSGNPVKVGGKARTADPAAVAALDRADLYVDTLGKPVVLQGAPHDLHVNGTANYTNTTAADVIAAGAAGVRIAVTSILVTNAHATVGTKVEIRDGLTVKIIGHAAAVGGGFAFNAGGRPLFISTAATAITARCVTTGADVDVSIGGYKIAN